MHQCTGNACFSADITGYQSALQTLQWTFCAGSDSGSSQGLRSPPVSFIRSVSQRPLRQAQAEAAGSAAPATPVSFIRSVSQRPLQQMTAEPAGSGLPAAPSGKKPLAGAGPKVDTGAINRRFSLLSASWSLCLSYPKGCAMWLRRHLGHARAAPLPVGL